MRCNSQSILILSSNLITAMLVIIFHCVANFPQTPSHSFSRKLRTPPSHTHDVNILSYFNKSLKSDFIDTVSPINLVHTNCSLPQRGNNCSYIQYEALLNVADRTVCKCDDSRLSIGNKCSIKSSSDNKFMDYSGHSNVSDVSIFAVTPTYKRITQKVDLTSLCYTIQYIQNIIWIVIEDSSAKTSLVTNLLQRCKVRSIHLNVKTSSVYKALKSRGVEQRNNGLNWIREYCTSPKSKPECQNGVLYFMDDDNKYDLRLFEEMKKTVGVSVFPVGFAGGLKFEGPVCTRNGSVKRWQARYAPERTFPMDMAGFMIHITTFLSKPKVKMGFTTVTVNNRKRPVRDGYLETDFLENFASRSTVECRGAETEIYVWHVKTLKPPLPYEAKHPSDPKIEV